MKADLSLSPFDATVEELVAAATTAEAAGFDAVWTYDHLSGASGGAGWVLDPWVTLTAVASATSRIGLGPLVVNATIRHPAHIAVAAATLQQLSAGRLLLGIGAGAGPGPYASELEMVGLPVWGAAERRRRTEEAIGAIRALWRGVTDLGGVHHGLAGAAGFLPAEPEPPVFVGANGPLMAALAGRAADGVNLHWFEPDLEGLAGTARAAATGPGFAVTVEAPTDEHWLHGPGRRRLEAVGADRVMYRWDVSMGTDAIERAADALGLASA
jgi:alkanesulfonate monooxygenase SsuD/methylene tetrahydromethanopterin reductase-like flavin-dependent oxidoreductase (luciferase family)